MIVLPVTPILLVAAAAAGPQLQFLGTARGTGGQFAATVAPGPHEGSEWVYASYQYAEDTFEILGVDPASGEYRVITNPVRGEHGARAMATSTDGDVYIGTLPSAHLLRLETRSGRVVDLGRLGHEEFVWGITAAEDGNLYAATYPGARVFKIVPGTGKVLDLGSVDSSAKYARSIASCGDGTVYVGTGAERPKVVAIDLQSHRKRDVDIPAAGKPGFAMVRCATDSASAYVTLEKRHYRVVGGSVTPLVDIPPASSGLTLGDGRRVTILGDVLHVNSVGGGPARRVHIGYSGREAPLFRIGMGPDGKVYASTMLPARLVRWSEEEASLEVLGMIGPGEAYSLLAKDNLLLIGAYAGLAPLMSFDPGKPLSGGPGNSNPALVRFADADDGWRPFAMIDAGESGVVVGAIAGYGRPGGTLTTWDVPRGTVTTRPGPVDGDAVVSLVKWGDIVIGGTSVRSGVGSRRVSKEAVVFGWNPHTGGIQFVLTPVPGASSVSSLVVAEGLVVGVAGQHVFAFEPEHRTIKYSRRLPFPGGVLPGSLGLGPDKRVWGLGTHAESGVFVMDPATGVSRVAARVPRAITAGFAMNGGAIYFGIGARLYRYWITPLRG